MMTLLKPQVATEAWNALLAVEAEAEVGVGVGVEVGRSVGRLLWASVLDCAAYDSGGPI